MKKRLSRFLYAITALVLVAGCSKDTDKTLENVPGTYSGDNITVTINNVLQTESNGKVEIIGTDASDMTFKIHNLVFGLKEYTITGCQIRVDNDNSRIFSGFNGGGESDLNTVIISGRIKTDNKKLVVDITTKGATGDYANENLIALVNGEVAPENAKIKITGTKITDATMILDGFVLGEEEPIEITGLQVTKEAAAKESDDDVKVTQKFTGEYSDEYKTVSVGGTITNYTMTVNVTVKNTSAVVGKWKIAKEMGLDNFGNETEVHRVIINVENTTGKIIFLGSEQDVNVFGPFLKMIAMGYGLDNYLDALNYFEFKENGSIALSFNDPQNGNAEMTIPNELIPEGTIRWYAKEGKVYFVVNMDLINMIPGGYGSIFSQLFEVKDGYVHVPINFTKTANGVDIYFDKAFLQQAFPIIKGLIPSEGLGDLQAIIEMVIPEMETIINESTKFEVGLGLAKVTE